MFLAGVIGGIILQASWGLYVYRLMGRGENFRKPSNIITMLLIQGAVLAITVLYSTWLTLGVFAGNILAVVILVLYLRITKTFNH